MVVEAQGLRNPVEYTLSSDELNELLIECYRHVMLYWCQECQEGYSNDHLISYRQGWTHGQNKMQSELQGRFETILKGIGLRHEIAPYPWDVQEGKMREVMGMWLMREDYSHLMKPSKSK